MIMSKKKLIILLLFSTLFIIAKINFMSDQEHHVIPKEIENEVNKALGYYPQLDSTYIEFKFKKNIFINKSEKYQSYKFS